jgi:hypothetical protein
VLRADTLGCELATLLTDYRSDLRGLLQKYGALLLRDFTLAPGDDFQRLRQLCFGAEDEPAPGEAALRDLACPEDSRPAHSVPQRCEGADQADYPAETLLFCEVAPARGGEARLTSNREIYAALDPEVRGEFEQRGLLYQRYLFGEVPPALRALGLQRPGGPLPRRWQQVFATEARSQVEAVCQSASLKVAWHDADDSTTISNHLPATRVHPGNRERVWFNRALEYTQLAATGWLGSGVRQLARITRGAQPPLAVCFGDGSPIPKAYLKHIQAVTERLTVNLPWHSGDLLLLDNLLTSHGRHPFRGQHSVHCALH